MTTLGFIGGTGPQGRGLALRFGMAGFRCVLGSRDIARAQAAAERAQGGLEAAIDVRGASNDEAARACDVAFVVVPYAAQATTLPDLRSALEGKLVVSCANALAFDDQGPHPVTVPDGSAAEEVARLLPGSRVAAAFQNVSAWTLTRAEQPLDVDVLVTADEDPVRAEMVALAGAVEGVRGVEAGALRLARPVEEITAVLLAVNRRYRAHAGLRLAGIDVTDG